MPPRSRATPLPEDDAMPENRTNQQPASMAVATPPPSPLALTTAERHGLQALDLVEQHCTLQAISTLGSKAEQSIMLAKAIQMAESALDPFQGVINGLKCTPLGFMLDKPETYDWPVLRRVIAEGMLRGARITGNEINGISKRCYLTQNYFVRKVREWPGLTITSEMFSIPRLVGAQTVVDYRIDYTIVGSETVQGHYSREGNNAIPVRVNDGMGADAIVGKAKRKAYAGLLEQLLQRSGQTWSPGSDGEIDDDRTTGVNSQPPRQVQQVNPPQSRFDVQLWRGRVDACQTSSPVSTAANLSQVGREIVSSLGLSNGMWSEADTADFQEIFRHWIQARLLTCTDANALRAVTATFEAITRQRPLPMAYVDQINGALSLRAAAIAGTSPGQATVPPG